MYLMPYSVFELLAISYHGLSTFSLQAKADPNLYLSGLSPLGCAAKEGDTKFLESLLKAGADPNLAENVNLCISLSTCDILSPSHPSSKPINCRLIILLLVF